MSKSPKNVIHLMSDNQFEHLTKVRQVNDKYLLGLYSELLMKLSYYIHLANGQWWRDSNPQPLRRNNYILTTRPCAQFRKAAMAVNKPNYGHS